MEISERSLLLQRNLNIHHQNVGSSGLSIIFAIICVVDVFGVFPIIALPKAIFDCGYIGILLVAVVCCIQIYTATLLGECWIIAENINPSIQFQNRYPYSALAEMTYGKKLSKFVNILLDLTVFGGGIPNLIVASQILQFLGIKLTDGAFSMSYCYWIMVIGIILCPFLWLGSPKDMKLLCSISAGLVILVFISILICITTDVEPSANIETLNENQFYLWQKVLIAYGILSFQFDIHPTILTIQMDMKNKLKIKKVIVNGFIVSLGLFCITSICIYLQYGSNVKPSVLEMLPSSNILYIGSILVAIQLSLSSSISNSALYQHIENCLNIPREFSQKRCILRSFLSVLSVLVAESVPRFDLVMSLIGGALTGPLVFILPPLFYIKMLSLKYLYEINLKLENFENVICGSNETSLYGDKSLVSENVTRSFIKMLHKILCYIIILFGVLATIGTTYLNVHNTIQYVTFTPPCIFSIYNNSLF